MVLKRHYSEEGRLGLGGEDPVQESKRRQTFHTVVKDVMKGLSAQEFVAYFEPLMRRVVREEFERVILPIIHSVPRNSLGQIDTSGSRGWQLHFRNKVPCKLFTSTRIETVDGTPLEIVVLDANSKRIVTTGPLSSFKVEILVLDGDFGSDAKEDWSKEEFDTFVIRERLGKRPLITGDLQLTIKDGVGNLGEVVFTDNSSWTRSRTFRLGVRVVSGSYKDDGIREARSEAFTVKDHRGVLYQKHHPPSLDDEVWRLEKIGKDGAFHNRLASNCINKVQDLLRMLVTDPSNLRNILGSGMSNKVWETIIQHAMSCTLDNKFYVYYNSERRVGLMFDSVYKLVGASFDGQSYKPLENLSARQMMLVDGLKHQAYRNQNEMVECDWPFADSPPEVLPLEGPSFPGASLDSQIPEFSITCRDQPATPMSPYNPSNAPPYILEDHGPLGDFFVPRSCSPVQLFSSIQRNSFKMNGPLASLAHDLNQWSPGELSMMGGHFIGDNISQAQIQNWLPVSASLGQGNGIFLASSGDETGIGFLSSTMPDISIHMSRSSKPKVEWFKIVAAIKWMILLRRVMAAKRRARTQQWRY